MSCSDKLQPHTYAQHLLFFYSVGGSGAGASAAWKAAARLGETVGFALEFQCVSKRLKTGEKTSPKQACYTRHFLERQCRHYTVSFTIAQALGQVVHYNAASWLESASGFVNTRPAGAWRVQGARPCAAKTWPPPRQTLQQLGSGLVISAVVSPI